MMRGGGGRELGGVVLKQHYPSTSPFRGLDVVPVTNIVI